MKSAPRYRPAEAGNGGRGNAPKPRPSFARERNRLGITGLAAVLLAIGVGFGVAQWNQHGERQRGQAIFHGEIPLAGRLEGHATPLPTMASRCLNCHEARDAAFAAAASTSVANPLRKTNSTFAAQLNREWLTTSRSRHGGPPTAYQAATLCELLRTGVDPAHVMVQTTMPRYEVSDAQCAALWSYLASR